MADFFINLFTQYPWLIYIFITIILAVIFILVLVIVQGREVSIGPFKIGKREIVSKTPTLNQSQMDELAKRISESVKEIKVGLENQQPSKVYQPTKLSDRHLYIYSARNDIQIKIARMVAAHDGWPGISLATFEIFFSLVQEFHLIYDSLAQEIKDFYALTGPMLVNDTVYDSEFVQAQYLATNINLQLDQIPLEG